MVSIGLDIYQRRARSRAHGSEDPLFLVCLAIPVRLLSAYGGAGGCGVYGGLLGHAHRVGVPDRTERRLVSAGVAALTAIAIVLMTIDNVFVATTRHRWILAFGFGLAFGFALSFSLGEMLSRGHPSRHVGAVVYRGNGDRANSGARGLVPALTMLFRIAISERVGVIVVSALVCHTAWHWMISRVTFLTTINSPLSDLLELLRWSTAAAFIAAIAVIVVGAGRRVFGMYRLSTPFDAAAKGRA